LGLSFLHLLTGHEPYEELLKDVKCPPYLAVQLHHIWSTSDPTSPYYVISEVISSLDADDDAGNMYPGMVLYHTLYRYMVLFDPDPEMGSPITNTAVWRVLVDALGLGGGGAVPSSQQLGGPKRGGGKQRSRMGATQSRDESLAMYARDKAQWSTAAGNHPIMAR
jgi:hypothetical protein